MAGENTTGAAQAQAADATQPPEGTTAGGQAPPAAGQAPAATTQPGTDESAEARATRLERELSEARKEAAAARTRAKALEQAQAAAAQAGMTEVEKAQARQAELEKANSELQVQVREQAIRTSAIEVATRLGYRSPDVAFKLLPRDELEFNDAGEPKNTEKLLRELLQREAYLGKAAGADYGGGNRGATPDTRQGMGELLRAALGK